jgi:endonuclease/exonuclease/phosphatase family metal-dependent hydrolase
MQVWPGDPLGFLIFAALGVLAFFGLLSALAARGASWAVAAFLLGASIDVALHAARATEDFHWADGFPDVGIVVLALGAASIAAWADRRGIDEGGAGPELPKGVASLAWGPFLFLHLEWLANVARVCAKTGLRAEAAGAVIVAGHALAIAGAAALPRGRAPAIMAGVALIASTSFAGRTGAVAVPVQLTAMLAAALLLREATPPPRGGALGPSLMLGAGAVSLILLTFAHYAGYDLPFPWERAHVWVGAAAILALVATTGSVPRNAVRLSPQLALIPATLAAALLLLPRVDSSSSAPPGAAPAAALPARASIVTFNLHAGFDERGDFAFATMMDSLRAQDADVIALQEVSRGWLINGCADLYEIARRSLPMASVFGSSVDTDWGNAVFTIAPIARSTNVPLPPHELALARAVLEAEIPIESSPLSLRVLATHFHHRADGESIRKNHTRFIAARFAEEGPSVLLGDFNALPGSESLRILEEAGWIDVAGTGAATAAPTYPSRAPDRRIDTIFVRGGIETTGADVLESMGSDHRPVRATASLTNERTTPRSPGS